MNRTLAATAAATALLALAASPPAAATTGSAVMAYPGMTIVQGNAKCTLAFIDAIHQIGYSAGHCNEASTVTDANGNAIGTVMSSRNNRANHAATGPDDTVVDYETISLNANVDATTEMGPTFAHSLITQPGVVPTPGMVVCHHGAATPSSCGEIDEVHRGWFTMKAGTMTSDHGDSGGPVFTYTDAAGSTPVIVGILRGRNGSRTAAVSWPATMRQAINDAADRNFLRRKPSKSGDSRSRLLGPRSGPLLS